MKGLTPEKNEICQIIAPQEFRKLQSAPKLLEHLSNRSTIVIPLPFFKRCVQIRRNYAALKQHWAGVGGVSTRFDQDCGSGWRRKHLLIRTLVGAAVKLGSQADVLVPGQGIDPHESTGDRLGELHIGHACSVAAPWQYLERPKNIQGWENSPWLTNIHSINQSINQ